MFYCDECKVKNDWPHGFRKSAGRCEDCGKSALCHDVPSSLLPRARNADEVQAPPAEKPVHLWFPREGAFSWCGLTMDMSHTASSRFADVTCLDCLRARGEAAHADTSRLEPALHLPHPRGGDWTFCGGRCGPEQLTGVRRAVTCHVCLQEELERQNANGVRLLALLEDAIAAAREQGRADQRRDEAQDTLADTMAAIKAALEQR